MIGHVVKNALKNILIATLIASATILLLEVTARLWGYSEKDIYDKIYMKYDNNDEIPFILKPNLIEARARGNIFIATNDKGLRTAIPGEIIGQKKDNEFRIAIIGDSITFGEGVKAEETFCMVVQRILNQSQNIKEVKCFNFGVSSYSIKEMVATLKYRVSLVDPDMVLICAITEDFFVGRCSQLDKYGYLSNPKWGESTFRDSWLILFLRKMHLTYPIRDLLSTLFYKSKQKPKDVPPSYSYLYQAKIISEKMRLPLLFVALPLWGDDNSNFAEIIKKLNNDKINYCDTSYLGTKYNKFEWRSLKYDFLHPSAVVHEEIGRNIAKCIEKFGVHNE
jgi:lysophospholipase L1-like esterase